MPAAEQELLVDWTGEELGSVALDEFPPVYKAGGGLALPKQTAPGAPGLKKLKLL